MIPGSPVLLCHGARKVTSVAVEKMQELVWFLRFVHLFLDEAFIHFVEKEISLP
jgi:hypothetical protein